MQGGAVPGAGVPGPTMPDAVADARQNALRNGIENCTFIADQAESALQELTDDEGRERFDVVVADPPRAGLHKKVIAGIVALGPPRIVYVSCNAETLAEDLSGLCASGYRIELAQPVDMFPHTPHCEVVACLDRADHWSGTVSD